MMQIIDELRSKFSEEELGAMVEKKRGEYHNLITGEAAQYLLALEIIGQKTQVENIETAKLRQAPCLLNAGVERIFIPQKYARNGQESITQRMEIKDQSGSAIIACHGAKSEAIGQEVLSGDLVQIGPAKFRGGEFYLLPEGMIKRIQKGRREKIGSKSPIGNFEGEVAYFFGDFEYKSGQATLKGDAPTQVMSAFELDDGSAKARVVLWQSPKLAGVLKKGMKVEIENGVRRNGEIHIGKIGRLVFKSEKKPLPEIEKIEVGEKVQVVAGKYRIIFSSFDLAAKKFGIERIPDGISAKTALGLKKDFWIGKPLPESWLETGKKVQ